MPSEYLRLNKIWSLGHSQELWPCCDSCMPVMLSIFGKALSCAPHLNCCDAEHLCQSPVLRASPELLGRLEVTSPVAALTDTLGDTFTGGAGGQLSAGKAGCRDRGSQRRMSCKAHGHRQQVAPEDSGFRMCARV